MGYRVVIIGIRADGLEGLSARSRAEIGAANFLAGGKRHLGLLGETAAQTFAVTNNLAELIARLRERSTEERWVVLASGDPLFFGIGHALVEALGNDQIVVEPTVSSMQLAFARAGLAWHDAALASIHGRPPAKVLLPLLGRHKIGLFTQDGASPAAVAEFFVERGLDDYDAWVAESLGTPSERVTALPITELVDRRFGDLNVLILRRRNVILAPLTSVHVPGIPDDQFAQPTTGPVLLTHADVRAMTLARFRDVPEGAIWDIGAGLGGVSVELARAFPDREVVAVERSDEQRSYLHENRRRFAAYNIRVVPGEAPDVLTEEESPAAVFLGGSGGRLDAILELVLKRTRASGVLVANFVSIENLSSTLARLRAAEWSADLTQVSVAHGQTLAGLTTLAPQRPVWVVRAARP
jgi:precorrin-6B C5,15-methyltransferase / cobalt-precorrin-6B C5,C15-methyltransferase